MADPALLHHLPLHFGMRVLGGLFALASVVAVVSVAVEKSVDRPLALALAAQPAIFATILRATVWRTRSLRARQAHLEVGSGARQRRVAFADVLAIERPWWALPKLRLTPVELIVRGSAPVLFFPAAGAEAYLQGRLAAAHALSPPTRPPAPTRRGPPSRQPLKPN